MIKTLSLIGIVFACALVSIPAAENTADPVAIIVHPKSPISELSMAELQKIFRGDRVRGPDGQRISVLMLGPGRPERQAVLKQIFKMNESEYSRHFLHAVFAGNIQAAPKELSTPAAMRQYVAATPGSIGYVRASEIDGTVKAVAINGLEPTDSAYPVK